MMTKICSFLTADAFIRCALRYQKSYISRIWLMRLIEQYINFYQYIQCFYFHKKMHSSVIPRLTWIIWKLKKIFCFFLRCLSNVKNNLPFVISRRICFTHFHLTFFFVYSYLEYVMCGVLITMILSWFP